jgi:hypothetical protein
MESKDVLLLVLPFISGIVSAWVTYFFAIRTKKNEAILKFKEEKYSNLLVLLKGFVGNTASADLKKKFFDEQYRSWLYSSDSVVVAINKLVELLIRERGKKPKSNEGGEVVGNIILQMRRDLLGKTKLTGDDFHYTDVIE